MRYGFTDDGWNKKAETGENIINKMFSCFTPDLGKAEFDVIQSVPL